MSDTQSNEAKATDNKEPEGLFWDFYVAGVKFHKLKTCIEEIKVNDFLNLVCEPTNKYDKNAIRIEYCKPDCEIMLGYVPKKISAEVTRAMQDFTLCCQVLEVNPENDTWTQLKVRVMESDLAPCTAVPGLVEEEGVSQR